MLFYYIRHGDPVYEPDSLTDLGHRQAEALAKRLALYGVDRIYSSTSNRAVETAMPTAMLLKKEIQQLDWAHEKYTWWDMNFEESWFFQSTKAKELLTSPDVLALGSRWYEHEAFQKYEYKKGLDRITAESDALFLSLGYQHIPGSGKYRVVQASDERIAFFAHQGFGIAFLSCLLDIPYSLFAAHFDIGHTGMTVIQFEEENGYAYPKVLTLSSDSHLYGEHLLTGYHNEIHF